MVMNFRHQRKGYSPLSKDFFLSFSLESDVWWLDIAGKGHLEVKRTDGMI
jgi:hypothetical protein